MRSSSASQSAFAARGRGRPISLLDSLKSEDTSQDSGEETTRTWSIGQGSDEGTWANDPEKLDSVAGSEGSTCPTPAGEHVSSVDHFNVARLVFRKQTQRP